MVCSQLEEYKIISSNYRNYFSNKNNSSFSYIEAYQDGLKGFVDCLLNKNLIKTDSKLKIIDLGFGLGTSLYNISKQIEYYDKIKCEYFGIDYDNDLYEYFLSHLKHKWANIVYYNSDVFNHEYSNYDIIFTYSPFNDDKMILNMYDKIYQEMKPGSIFFDVYNSGRGYRDILRMYCEDRNIEMTECYFGKKKKLIIVKK